MPGLVLILRSFCIKKKLNSLFSLCDCVLLFTCVYLLLNSIKYNNTEERATTYKTVCSDAWIQRGLW